MNAGRGAGWRRGAWFAVVGLLAACAAPKPASQFEVDFDEQAKPWQELQAELPPQPRDDNLVTFAVSGAAHYRFALDAYSLSIGSDGVFRYILVATSEQGSRNVSYEGIRCQSAQKKLYAIGRPDGSWSRVRNAAWSPIEEVGNNRQHAALMKEFFCPQAYPAHDVPEILARMRVTLPSTVW